jgi:hypothetical protein
VEQGDAAVVLHLGRVMAAGDVPDIIRSAGAVDMRGAFTALTDGSAGRDSE